MHMVGGLEIPRYLDPFLKTSICSPFGFELKSHALHALSYTLMHSHHNPPQPITVHHSPSQSMRLHQTLICLQKMEIDGKRSKLISRGIEGSSGEVSARRSRIFGSRPKKLIVKKWGVQKGPGSNFRWSPGRPPKSVTGRSPSLKTESNWLPTGRNHTL